MRYADSPEQEAWRQEVRRFVRRQATPALRAELRARGNEGEGPLARAFHRQLFDKGWWGIGWPKEFGGLGKSAVDQYIFIEEMEAAARPGCAPRSPRWPRRSGPAAPTRRSSRGPRPSRPGRPR